MSSKGVKPEFELVYGGIRIYLSMDMKDKFSFREMYYGIPTTPEDILKVDNDILIRASKDCICEVCGLTYGRHPFLTEYDWLVKLCDGSLYHL